jgi:hypothetical protein
MKKLTIAAAAAVLATQAFAGDHTISTRGRMSWMYEDRDTKTTQVKNSSEIKAEQLYLALAGKLSANTTYNITLNLADSSTAATAGKDNTNNYIDELYITRTLAEGLNLQLGKMAVIAGGVEYVHAEEDMYSRSAFYNNAPANEMALVLSKEFVGQTLSLQYFNGNNERTTTNSSGTTVSAQSKFGYAAQYAGSFANGLVKPNIGYTVDPTTRSKGPDTYLAGGLQFNLPASFVVEADYGLKTLKKAGTAGQDNKLNSMSALVVWSGLERFSPSVKFIKDTDKTNNGAKVSDTTTYTAALEYKDSKEDAIRYHVAYSSAKVKPVTGSSHTDATVLVGAKFDVALLK